MVELLKTKCMPRPILLDGLDACSVSSCQLRSLNHVVVLCARKTLMSILLKSPRSVLKSVAMRIDTHYRDTDVRDQ